MTYEATAIFDNGREIVFELQDDQVCDFAAAVFNKLIYTDARTGVISWLPPDRLLHLIIKPNMESHPCQKSQPSDQVRDLLS
jgi:hypothetical protein